MLGSLFSSSKSAGSKPAYQQSMMLEINGQDVPIQIKHNNRAKRYTLRMPQVGTTPILTIPKYGTHSEAVDFARRHTGWLAARIADRPQLTAFEPDVLVPLRGEPHRLVSSGKARGVIHVIDEEPTPLISVSGDPRHFERRVTDWLKEQARADITAACHYHADNLGLHFRSISIRDQRTRWGSCSTGARLNFSWRLILAPREVLDYVAAHEVAHLQEMNHKPQFWSLVEKTCPEMAVHKSWLRKHGTALHSYGSL